MNWGGLNVCLSHPLKPAILHLRCCNWTKHDSVVGATGDQGSVTVDAFLGRGFAVRGLTRSVDSPAVPTLPCR